MTIWLEVGRWTLFDNFTPRSRSRRHVLDLPDRYAALLFRCLSSSSSMVAAAKVPDDLWAQATVEV